jgi:hypothetical protein
MSFSFTPGFSPVITYAEIARNRFSGFPAPPTGLVLRNATSVAKEKETVETVVLFSLYRRDRAKARSE